MNKGNDGNNLISIPATKKKMSNTIDTREQAITYLNYLEQELFNNKIWYLKEGNN